MSDDKLRSAAADVVGAFESLGKTSDAAGLLVSRSLCEAAMLKLSAALKDGHGVGIPAAPQPPAKAACDCGDVYQAGTLGADEISRTGRCPGCNAEADAKSDHLVDANKMTRAVPVAKPLTREQIEFMRKSGMEPDDYPEPWAYARGVRDAELAHGIGQPVAGEGGEA
jgi:hypothetical protein